MKLFRYVLFFVNIIAVFALFISYLTPYFSPEANKYIPLFGLFYPYLFFINVLFFLGWVFTKWTYSLLSLAALLIGFSAAQRFISFKSPKVFKSENIIQVASYNLASGSKIGKNESEEFYEFVKEELDHGIVFFQESSSKIREELQSRFKGNRFVMVDGKRVLIMSQYPILDNGILDFSNSYNNCLWADIDFHGKKIRVYSVHLQSNGVTVIAKNVRKSGDINDKETWNRVGKMMKLYARSTAIRVDQAHKLLDDINSINHPVIVGGDFNDVPQSYLYTQLNETLNDSFTERGSGLGTSFNGAIPALRIDYIFSDKNFTVLDYKMYNNDYSDHFAISSKILIPTD